MPPILAAVICSCAWRTPAPVPLPGDACSALLGALLDRDRVAVERLTGPRLMITHHALRRTGAVHPEIVDKATEMLEMLDPFMSYLALFEEVEPVPVSVVRRGLEPAGLPAGDGTDLPPVHLVMIMERQGGDNLLFGMSLQWENGSGSERWAVTWMDLSPVL